MNMWSTIAYIAYHSMGLIWIMISVKNTVSITNSNNTKSILTLYDTVLSHVPSTVSISTASDPIQHFGSAVLIKSQKLHWHTTKWYW